MTRALSPVIGVPLLVGITVLLGATVGVFALGITPPPSPQTPLVASVTVSADTNQITLINDGGQTIDIRTVDLRIKINGTPLVHQPPVPFFAAKGFRSGPTGPFNSATSPLWNPSEEASLRLASTNSPQLTKNSLVTISMSINNTPVLELETKPD